MGCGLWIVERIYRQLGEALVSGKVVTDKLRDWRGASSQ